MFFVQTVLPGTLTDHHAEKLSDCLSLYAETQSAIRNQDDQDTPHDQRPWILRWAVDTELTAEQCQNHLEICARECGVSIPGPGTVVWDIQSINPDTNWLAQSYQAFPPFTLAPFFIYGSYYDGDVPDNLMGLQIDAATAFGSGEHGTTAGCLNAMVALKNQGMQPKRILDMGTGSGILAIAARKLWTRADVLAVDNDPEAVNVSERHAAANCVTLNTACGDGFKTPEVHNSHPYDLVIANILAGPLVEMASDLVAVVGESRHVILSGILNEQADRVSQAYIAQGLELQQHDILGEWTTLTFQKA